MKNFKYTSIKLSLISLLPLIISIGGCTLSAEQKVTQLTPEQINTSVNEWNELQPEIKRLIAMEKELIELKGLLMKLSQAPTASIEDINNEPLVPINLMTDKNNESHVNQSLSATPSMIDDNADTIKHINPDDIGSSAIQIGAFASKSDLILATEQFYQRFGSLKATTSAYSEPVVLGKALFRLKVGPFNSFKIAVKQCNTLKQEKVDCLPTKLKASGILIN